MSAIGLPCNLPRIQQAAKRRFWERETTRRASYYETAMSAFGTLDVLASRRRAIRDGSGRARLSFYGRLALDRYERDRRAA